jgi:hypothetical protein
MKIPTKSTFAIAIGIAVLPLLPAVSVFAGQCSADQNRGSSTSTGGTACSVTYDPKGTPTGCTGGTTDTTTSKYTVCASGAATGKQTCTPGTATITVTVTQYTCAFVNKTCKSQQQGSPTTTSSTISTTYASGAACPSASPTPTTE